MSIKWLKPTDKIWCIIYVEGSYIENLDHDLAKNIFEEELEVYIPTIKILDKQKKGQKVFREVPLLFNYGFVKLTVQQACNQEFLKICKDHISCLYSWVKDQSKQSITITGWSWDDDYYPSTAVVPAVAKDSEIEGLKKAQIDLNIYTEEQLNQLVPGQTIQLFTYPWEGISAVILKVNKQKQEALVEIDGAMNGLRVNISFDNLVYTLYRGAHDVDNYGKEKVSIDEIRPFSY